MLPWRPQRSSPETPNFDIAINRYFPSSQSRSLTSLNLELHTLIEKSGTVFNLMGVAMSRAILDSNLLKIALICGTMPLNAHYGLTLYDDWILGRAC